MTERRRVENPIRSPRRRAAYGAVIAWIVGWFLFLLVQGICPVP